MKEEIKVNCGHYITITEWGGKPYCPHCNPKKCKICKAEIYKNDLCLDCTVSEDMTRMIIK